MRIYLSGPMTGYEGFNYAAFDTHAARLREAGYEVVSPAENFGGADTHPEGRKAFMRLDMEHVLSVDAVAVLPGWEKSKGAQLEVLMARELELPILDVETMQPYSETVLQEAQRLVGGDRGKDYGHPIDDFTRTGRMWGAILGIDDVPPEKVALCMVAVKMSRECNAPKRDNVVDIAGYAQTLAMVRERQDETR